MRIENRQLKDFISDSEMVKKEDLELAFNEAENQKKKLGDILIEKKLIDEIKLRKLYAYILGVPFVDLTKEIIDQDILQVVPEPIARKYRIVAFERSGRDLKVAMLNPEDIQTIDFIRKKSGLKIITCLTSGESMDNILKQYKGKKEIEDRINSHAYHDYVENNLTGKKVVEKLREWNVIKPL